MARETAKERRERLAAESATYEAEQAVRKEAFRMSVPKRLMEARKLAEQLGVSCQVSLSETGPLVHFYNSESSYINVSASYEIEEWELDSLESDLELMKQERDNKIAQQALAQAIFDTLTTEQKTAIKQYIHYLR